MSWTCPKCKRSFKNRNQYHSCIKLDSEDHLTNKPLHIKEAYNAIVKLFENDDNVSINTVKSGILLKTSTSFVSLKPRKTHLEVEFALAYEADEFPVYKTTRISKKLVAHFVKIESAEDVTKQLKKWLFEAKELA